MKLLRIIFFCLTPSLLLSQWEYAYRNIQLSDGLPSNTIYDIKQASDGSILIGHEKGISRFNGVSFSHYSEDKTTPLSNIIELEPHKYLCRSFNDECYFTLGNQLIKQNQLSEKSTGYSNYLQSKDYCIYKINNTSVEKIWNGVELVFEEIVNFKESGYKILSATIIDSHILINAMPLFSIYNLKNGNIEYSFELHTGPKTICTSFNNEFLILGTISGKNWRISLDGIPSALMLPDYNTNDKYSCNAVIQDSLLAIGTFGGLYLYDKNYELIRRTFTDKQITAIEVDVENNLWLGTQLEGILVIPSTNIVQIHNDFFLQNKFSISNLITVYDSLIIAGSYDGRVAFFSNEGSLLKMIDLEGKSEVQALFFDENNQSLYADCLNLYEIDAMTYQVKSVYKSRSIKDLFVKNDTLYMATSFGILVGENAENYAMLNEKLWCKKIVPFNDGFLIESIDGLYHLYHSQLTQLNESFIGGDENQVLIAKALNQSSGRISFAVGNKIFEVIGKEVHELVNLPNFKTKSIVSSADKVWITDGSKIYKFHQDRLEEINASKGLLIHDITKLALFQENLLVVGTQKVQLFKEDLKANKIKPKLRIVNSKGSFELDEGLFFSQYKQNLLDLELEVLPNISSRGSDEIFYRIPTIIREWTPVINSKLVLERLPYGKHQLEIVAYNEDGVRSEAIQVSLKINPPYYATWWFILISLAAFIGVIILVSKWRIRRIKKENAKALHAAQVEAKAIQAELKALRTQINPHFIFNSLTAIHSKILNGDSRSAYEHLSTFSSLLRKSLKFTSKEFLSLEEELSFLKDYVSLEQSRSNDSFDFLVDVDPQLDLNQLKFPSLLSQPFVENAIRHGLAHSKENKTLKLLIKKSSNGYELIIEDNGIGRKQSREINAKKNKSHESFATKAMEERIQMINVSEAYQVSLDIIDLAEGTKVIITVKT